MTLCIPDTTDWACLRPQVDVESMDDDVRHRAEAFAWYTLAAMCAYQIGVCATEVRPVAARCAPWGSWVAAPVRSGVESTALPLQTIGGLFTPYVTGGAWVNGCGCGRPANCGCTSVDEVYLPGPVGDIEWVKLDGEILDPSKYRVDFGDRLVSLDPDAHWPGCPDMTAGADEVGSFVVRYYRGAAPNELTNHAAAVLANEYAKACLDDKKCRLPRGTTNIIRQGVTIDIGTDYWESIRSTIPEVAAVVNIYNPNGLTQAPRVKSPELRRRSPRSTTWSRS